MSKIKKYKNIIVILLVFFISFNLITETKQKEVQAAVVVDDITLLIILGTVVVATGINAIKKEQVPDMGMRVKDTFLDLGGNLEDMYYMGKDGLVKGINLGNDLLKKAIDIVSSNLPTEDIQKVQPINVFNGNVKGINVPVTIDRGTSGSHHVFGSNMMVTIPDGLSTINLGIRNSQTNATYTVPLSIPTKGYGNTYEIVFRHYSASNKFFGLSGLVNVGIPSTFDSSNVILESITFSNESNAISSQVEYITIPYSNPVIKTGLDSTKTETNLKDKTYIPFPEDLTYIDDLSTDFPMTWDSVKDMVVEDVETDVTEPGGDNNNEEDYDESDIPDSFKWLARLLTFLFSPFRSVKDFLVDQFTQLIDNIKNIPNVISDFFTNITDKISSLPSTISDFFSSVLTKLFTPTVTVSDLFAAPSGSGFALVTSLFNFDSLWNIEPKPYRFKADWNYKDVTKDNNNFIEPIELRPFEVDIVQDNIVIIRNILSYALLIAVIWFIIIHFLPERSMD